MTARICPACGRGFSAAVIRRGGFRCPTCRQRLRLGNKHGRAISLATLAVAALSCYVAGASGPWLIFAPLILYWPLSIALGIIQGLFFPKLIIDKPRYGDTDFHITGDPGP
jgi:DNA-directed RNA polymerase subunit RPC12/RpoP